MEAQRLWARQAKKALGARAALLALVALLPVSWAAASAEDHTLEAKANAILSGSYDDYPNKPQALVDLGPEVLPALLTHLNDEQAENQTNVLFAIALLKDARATQPLLEHLQSLAEHWNTEDKEAVWVGLSVYTLGQLAAKEATPTLLEMLDTPQRDGVLTALLAIADPSAQIPARDLALNPSVYLPTRLLAARVAVRCGSPETVAQVAAYLCDVKQVFSDYRQLTRNYDIAPADPPVAAWVEALLDLNTPEAEAAVVWAIKEDSNPDEHSKAIILAGARRPLPAAFAKALLDVAATRATIEDVRLNAYRVLLEAARDKTAASVVSVAEVQQGLAAMQSETEWDPTLLQKLQELSKVQ